MKVLLVVLPLVLMLALILSLTWGFALRSKCARQGKILAGIEDPKAWLSDEDRRKYALELLERETDQYQDGLIRRYEEQVKQFNTPTIEGEGK